jgi:hypothetical protein
LGFGFGVLGFWVWAQIPNPQSPIPNPQSPIDKVRLNYNKEKNKKLNIIFFIFINIYIKYQLININGKWCWNDM